MRPLHGPGAQAAQGAILVSLILAAAAAGQERPVDFARDVRPIFSSACFACHGPDSEQREADLRLDREEGALTDRGGYAAFVPGKPDGSEAFRRMTAADADEKMPPPDSGKSLSEEQISIVRRWIEQGAKWSRHWAFIPPVRPELPAVSADEEWTQSPIDAFILARRESEGVRPAPPADRTTLLRRLSLDLIGLPPTIEEMNHFLADERPDAYERQVDRLLASPHFGELWGRRWLDAARYADSDGFEKDKPREVWFYRDWVIGAVNRDLPYDRFIVEQIAGDLLPGASQDQVVATGFLRNSMINEEGGIDPEQFRMEAMFDRMDAVGKSVLGLTIQCAQCHNHKYDPLTQTEYYRLFAFLNNCHEGQITVYTQQQQAQRRRVLAEIRAVEDELKASMPDWRKEMGAWESDLENRAMPEWQVAELSFDDSSIGGQKFLPQADGSYLAQGYAPTKFRPKMTLRTSLEKITAVRLELLTDPNLPHGGPGRSVTGTCALTEFEVEAAPADRPGQAKKLAIAEAGADVNPPETPLPDIYFDKSNKRRVTGPIELAFDGNEETAWGIDVGPGRRNQPREAVFRLSEPVAYEGGAVLNVYLTQKHGGWNSDDNQTHNIGRFRISVTSADLPSIDPLPPRVREILGRARQERSEAEQEALFSYWRTTVDQWKDANERIESLWAEHPEGTSQLVLLDRAKPRSTHRLDRGEFLKPREEVAPGVPAFLHPLDAAGPPSAPYRDRQDILSESSASDAGAAPHVQDRLDFAHWLVDEDSPTTARAIVNRVWQGYFGVGHVATSEDLGSQGETPSHPKLLDWLAVELMESGWSLKHVHRLIVTSSTYQQSSHVTPELLARDPYNRLLARGPRVRLEAEVVRDAVLAASGMLDRRIGGRSVFPAAPEFLFQPPASYGPKTWATSTGGDQFRRGIYTFRFRSVPYPALDAFDAPNGDIACVRRSRSNTPIQALTTLNEPTFMDAARALALVTLREAEPSGAARLEFLFRRCLGRPPAAAESGVLLDLLARQRERFAAGDADPLPLAAADPDHPPALPAGAAISDHAAWTAVARVVLNLDEMITKE